MRMILAGALILAPHLALAAGSDDSEPPKPTATTTECTKGEVWDERTASCIKAEDQSLNDDQRFGAVRLPMPVATTRRCRFWQRCVRAKPRA